MLITRPNHDITTMYLYYWSISLITYAQKIGTAVVDLSAKRANAKELLSILKKVDPFFVVFNGHGNEKTITGYDNEPLITADDSVTALSKKIVYARSCSSAKELGKKSVKKGCKAYIGYDDEFVFVIESNKLSRPLKDTSASLFLEPANQVVIVLLKGHTVFEANRRSKEMYRKNAQKFTTSSATSDEKDLIPFLVWDYSHQVCLGDQEAKL